MVLTIIITVSTALTGWLWRHERWFRDRVFPVMQSLTGKSPTGRQPDPTDAGHFEETDQRIKRVERLAEKSAETAEESLNIAQQTKKDIADLSEEVETVGALQREHHRQTERVLQTIVEQTEGITRPEVNGQYFTGRSESDEGETEIEAGADEDEGEDEDGDDGTPGFFK